MYVLRPINANDFDALKQIAIESGHGFTSLPVDDNQLKEKIERAEHSFSKQVNKPNNESYLFVLEDTQTNEIVGTTAIEAAVGLTVPLYHYHLGKTVHHSPTLNVYNTVDILSMCNDYTGCSEICTLFLRERNRQGLTGRFLSRARFLFMGQHNDRFADTVIAEMRGVSDENGHSPFWQWLQEHFFSIEFPKADHLVGLGDKGFISELMPKYPIYTNLLSKKAQAVIGHVHEKTKPALKLLEKEGFEYRGYVDLFDAGPTVETKLNNIHSIRASKVCSVTINNETMPLKNKPLAICNLSVTHFRATFSEQAYFDTTNRTLMINPDVANALKVTEGEQVRYFCL
jgi:arginine N-succinyltransferase